MQTKKLVRFPHPSNKIGLTSDYSNNMPLRKKNKSTSSLNRRPKPLSREKQRLKGTVIFPAIEISNEIEKIEDTTCIDTNRDELLKSFCSFTSDLDKVFKIQGITDKKAKSFWPNICCKERNDDDKSKKQAKQIQKSGKNL